VNRRRNSRSQYIKVGGGIFSDSKYFRLDIWVEFMAGNHFNINRNWNREQKERRGDITVRIALGNLDAVLRIRGLFDPWIRELE
jgi:hypothetical protein